MSKVEQQKEKSVFANRDFRLIFFGSSISALGDQFTLVALPWLVLKLTGDPAQLGIVLAVMALPRAAFMLIGGAVVDRMSPRRVLLASRGVNALLIALLAILVLSGTIQMGLLYALAFGIGLSTAFAYPASTAILPQLLEPQQLHAANAVMMGVRQLSMLLGPALAGFVVTFGSSAVSKTALADSRGMGLAFTIDAISFAFSLASLYLIRIHSDIHPPRPEGGILADIAKGMRFIWADVPLRMFILYVGVVSVFVGGPLQVGLPVLADTRLDWGATSLGLLMTANGTGILLGSLFSRLIIHSARGRLGFMILSVDTFAGLMLASLTLVHSTLAGAALLVSVGLFAGVVQIAVFTWIQQRVPQAMMGRTMSLLMFTFMGLGPISAALAGALLKLVPLTVLFAGAGFALSSIALFGMSIPGLRGIAAAAPAATSKA